MPDETKTKSRRSRSRYGEGSVWQRADGSWRGQVSVGTGKFRKRRYYQGDSKQSIIDQIARGRTQQIDGTLPEQSSMTVEQYLTHWLETIRAGTVAGSTADSYGRNIRIHLLPVIGGLKLQKLAAAHIEAALNKIAGRALRRYVLIILSRALKSAVKKSLIVVNPCGTIDRPRPEKFDIHPLDREQASEFLAAIAGHHRENLFVLALGTGARQGELCALQWKDYDRDRKTLSIRHTLSTVGGKIIVKAPKTKSGARSIVLDDRSIAALERQRKENMRIGAAGEPWIFCQADGALIDRHALNRMLHRILKKAGLPIIRFHDLRHTHATMLFLAGVNPKVVQERLGHATIAITLDIYGHVLPSMQADAVDRFNKLFA